MGCSQVQHHKWIIEATFTRDRRNSEPCSSLLTSGNHMIKTDKKLPCSYVFTRKTDEFQRGSKFVGSRANAAFALFTAVLFTT